MSRKKQENRALSISNDISEDIDNGETRKELREAIRWWANLAAEQGQELGLLRFNMKIIKIAMTDWKE